jgi:hypothetical protein
MEQTCSDCGFDASRSSPREVAEAIPRVTSSIRESLLAIDAATIRRRSARAVWSPLEYVGHLREAMAFHRWLIETALAEDKPAIPMVDPDESVANAKYSEAEPGDLIAQFERRIQRLRTTILALDNDSIQRTLTLGADQISVALIARSAWHECHHHLGDIRRLGGLDSPHATSDGANG